MNSPAPDRLTFTRRAAGAFAAVPWRTLSLRHVVAGLALGALVFAMHLASSLVPLREYGAGNVVHTALSDLLGAFCIMLAVVAADHARVADSGRRAIYVFAVLIGAGAWAGLEYAGFRAFGVGVRWYSTVPYQNSGDEETVWRTVYGFLEWLLIGGAATFMYLDGRRARAEQVRLRRAEIERALTAKRTLESELQAMQARVEPQFLFSTMAQVRRLYDVDAALGERMLDELIAYLRAAMPRMRDTTSSVAREMELARAYLGIVKVRLGDRLRAEFSISDESARGRMPPMILLPLIDRAIAQTSDVAASRRMLRISSEVAGRKLKIRIVDSASGFAVSESGDDISSMRERLIALYGDQAQLRFTCEQESSVHASIELPFEAFEDDDDRFDPDVAVRAEHVS